MSPGPNSPTGGPAGDPGLARCRPIGDQEEYSPGSPCRLRCSPAAYSEGMRGQQQRAERLGSGRPTLKTGRTRNSTSLRRAREVRAAALTGCGEIFASRKCGCSSIHEGTPESPRGGQGRCIVPARRPPARRSVDRAPRQAGLSRVPTSSGSHHPAIAANERIQENNRIRFPDRPASRD